MYIPSKKSRLFKRRNNMVSGEHYSFSSSSSSGPLGRYSPETRRKILKYLLYGAGIFVFLIITLFVWYSRDLPNPYKINGRDIAQSTQILDRNGKLLYDIHGEENRTLMKIDDIPENIKKATVAIEDQDFYKHMGIDLKGVARAFFYDIVHRNATQGGSTITQQFVKNALLTSDKSVARKIKELILSIEIEKVYSKNEILGMYLNEIPYGNNAYGIYSASKTYFGKEPKDLTLAESALLASVPQAPTYYNPYGSNTDVLMARKDYTLDKMVELGLTTKADADVAKKEEIKFVQQDQGILAPHFVMYIKDLLAQKYGEDRLQQGGLIVTTSLDLDKQKIAEDVLTNSKANLKASGASNASLVSMDPKTGEILAMVGSVDYFDTANDGNVNVSIRPRQPGSSLKPFIYGLAFNNLGYAPSTMMMDVQTDFGQGYKPGNYDGQFRGPVSIRKSLGNSLNIPAVETLAMVGVKNATDFAQKMGLTTLTDPDRYGLSLVLGGGEVKLLEEVNAYSVLANGGIKHDIHSILKITDSSGKVLEEYKSSEDKGTRILDENPNYLVTNILSDDNARAEIFGMGGVLTLPGRPVAAKTGTTDEYRDAWTFGYTPSVVTGVWAGNNNNAEMNHGSGAMVAAPIWNSYMKQILSGTPVEQFAVPSGIVHVPVDALTGMLPLSNLSPETAQKLPTADGIFWSKFQPQATDSVHKVIKVVKGGDKLADSDCPDSMTEEKVFLEFHSINPSNPNWENAVVAWAKAAGHNNVPTEKESCKDAVKENQPTITINSPLANADISGKLTIIISYIAKKDVDKIEYYIDDEKIAEKKSGDPTNAGNNFNLEDFALPATLSGKANIKVVLTDKLGLKATDEVSVNIK
ncbi:MAG: transglycosylase domain-containing protein [Patescibacteria group bacterium]|nr:transglycosylase domain-containing protein [Patescibacteria group bacterium]